MSEAVHDAGDPGCGDGLAAWVRDRLRETRTRVVLCTIVRDPAARVELAGLARLMGQRVVSIEALDEHGYAEWSVWAKKVVTL